MRAKPLPWLYCISSLDAGRSKIFNISLILGVSGQVLFALPNGFPVRFGWQRM